MSDIRAALDFSGADWLTFPGRRMQLFTEIALVSALTVFALLIRIWDIGNLPPAPAGDESAVALETIRIINGEWIGIWSGVALGHPTGQMFWVAPFFWLGGPTLTMLHLAPVLPGVALVPVCYLMVRMLFPLPVAYISASFVAFFSWFAIIYRIGIPITLSVFIVTCALCIAVYAVRSRRLSVAVAGGLALGAGLYVFKGYVIYFVAVWMAILVVLAFSDTLLRRWELYLFLGASLVAGIAMIEFYATTNYLSHNLSSQYQVHWSDLLSLSAHLDRMLEVLLYVHLPPGDGTTGFDGIIPKALLHPVVGIFLGGPGGVAVVPQPTSFPTAVFGMADRHGASDTGSRRRNPPLSFGRFFVLVITAIGFTTIVQQVLNRWISSREDTWVQRSGISKTGLRYTVAIMATVILISLFAARNLNRTQGGIRIKGG